MSNKQEIVEQIMRLRKRQLGEFAEQIRANFETHSTQHLQQLLGDLREENGLPRFTADEQLADQRIQTANQQAAALRSHELLVIFRHSGLSNAQINERLLDELLPGTALTFQNFRSLIANNPDLAKRFNWVTEPFAPVVQVEQQQTQQATKDRGVFSAVCRALAVKELANVSDVESNYAEVRRHIVGPLTAENVTNLILHGDLNFAFAPNSNHIVKDWIDEAALRERRALALEVAKDYSQDEGTRQQVFERLMTPPIPLERLRKTNDSNELRKAVGQNSTYETTEQLRGRVQDIRGRRAARAMSKEELHGIVAADAQQRRDSMNPLLPESITAQAIRNAQPERLRKLIRVYGADLLNQRLNGVSA